MRTAKGATIGRMRRDQAPGRSSPGARRVAPALRALPPAPQWDARLARRLVMPLRHGPITPNHLTTLRLAVGLAACAAFVPGTWGWSNLAALLLVLSNFLDHADGELARVSGRTSRFGHYYDLASDALITIALFVAIGAGAPPSVGDALDSQRMVLGAIAGTAIALIFYLRMRIEQIGGKDASRQPALGGFEGEDVLYLMPLVTVCNGLVPLLLAATIGAPLYAIWVMVEYLRVTRRGRSGAHSRVDAPTA